MLCRLLLSCLVLSPVVSSCWWTSSHALGAPPQTSTKPHALYAFCFDIPDALKRDLPQQAEMLREVGFDGAGHVGLEGLPERIATLEKAKLQLMLAGTPLNLTQDAAPQLAAVEPVLPLLKDRDVLLYIVLSGLPAGDPQGMDRAVPMLQKLSDQAAKSGVRIGIYPHTGDWVTTLPQAVAVAKNVNRPNCGVIFNLCHFLRNEPADSLDEVLQQAQPYLYGVTINGADLSGTNDPTWRQLIQPLDRGSFDVPGLLRKLDQLGYTGPIGLMCYGIEGDAQHHLARSLAVWRKWQSAGQ